MTGERCAMTIEANKADADPRLQQQVDGWLITRKDTAPQTSDACHLSDEQRR